MPSKHFPSHKSQPGSLWGPLWVALPPRRVWLWFLAQSSCSFTTERVFQREREERERDLWQGGPCGFHYTWSLVVQRQLLTVHTLCFFLVNWWSLIQCTRLHSFCMFDIWLCWQEAIKHFRFKWAAIEQMDAALLSSARAAHWCSWFSPNGLHHIWLHFNCDGNV